MNALTLITPPSQLVTEHKTGDKTKYAFPLQTAAWLKMQMVVREAIVFPLSADGFTQLYGTFSDQGVVNQAISILGQINTTCQQYGDPTKLISQLGAFAKANTAPGSIYGNAVWLASQTMTSANQIKNLLDEGLTAIGEERDAAKRLDDLKQLLTGQGGITEYTSTLNSNIASFETITDIFYTTLDQELNGKTSSLAWYLGQSDNILADAKELVKSDQTLIDDLNSKIKKLNDEYIGFTVAASSSPVFLLVPFVGPVIAVADAVTFGVLAVETKKALDKARSSLKDANKDYQQKASLVRNVEGFNGKTTEVGTDGTEFLDAIATLTGGWAKFETQINTQLGALTAKDLENWSAFMQRINFEASKTAWDLIATTAETFYDSGFAKFNPSNEQDSP